MKQAKHYAKPRLFRCCEAEISHSVKNPNQEAGISLRAACWRNIHTVIRIDGIIYLVNRDVPDGHAQHRRRLVKGRVGRHPAQDLGVLVPSLGRCRSYYVISKCGACRNSYYDESPWQP